MKGFIGFMYAILVVFTCIGCIGYTAMTGEWQFVIALSILFIILLLAFIKVITLPTKDNFRTKYD